MPSNKSESVRMTNERFAFLEGLREVDTKVSAHVSKGEFVEAEEALKGFDSIVIPDQDAKMSGEVARAKQELREFIEMSKKGKEGTS